MFMANKLLIEGVSDAVGFVGGALAGFWLGHAFKNLPEGYYYLVVFAVIVVSVMPAFIHLWRTERHEIFALIKTKILRRPAAKDASEPKKDEPAT